jgi:outer membrane lipoprotein-sorting protein
VLKRVFLFLFLSSTSGFSAGAPTDTLINSIQVAWDKISSYEAEFHQTVTSKGLGTREETQGTLQVQKPLKLRWETPAQNSIQILNGSQLWQIRKSKRRKTTQVDHYRDISKLVDARSLSFLSGKISIKKSYKYKILADSPKSVLLALTPLSGGLETYLAEILKPSYSLGALKIESPESETRIVFSNVRANVSLPESLFQYEPGPQDVVQNN